MCHVTSREELEKLPLHERYKRLWEDSGLEQQPFADLVGINRTSFSKFANGKLDPGPKVAERMAAYSGHPATLFYDGKRTATETRVRRIARDELATVVAPVMEQLAAALADLHQAIGRFSDLVDRAEAAEETPDGHSSQQ